MNAKEYMRQYLDATSQITVYAEKIMRLQAQATKITSVLTADRIQSSSQDKMPDMVAKIMEAEEALEREIEIQLKAQNLVVEAIRMLPYVPQRQVMQRRYLLGMKWEQIAVALNYNYQHVLRLHGRALDYLTEKLGLDEQNFKTCD